MMAILHPKDRFTAEPRLALRPWDVVHRSDEMSVPAAQRVGKRGGATPGFSRWPAPRVRVPHRHSASALLMSAGFDWVDAASILAVAALPIAASVPVIAGRVNSGRSFAARHEVHAAGAAAALGAGHVAGRAVAHSNFGHDHFPHGHLAHNFHNFPGGYGYGWYGPLFWPYAYDDIFDDLFWAFGYGDPFWGYGCGDIYGGLFSPYGYDDLAGYLPGGAYGQAGTSSGPASRVIGSTGRRQTPLSSQLSQMRRRFQRGRRLANRSHRAECFSDPRTACRA
jgi:hypothetical protein